VDIMKALDIDDDITDLIVIRRLTYFDHVAHMSVERLLHSALYRCMDGSRTTGRPRKKWLDNVKEDCADINFNLVEATQLTEDVCCWSEYVRPSGYQNARTLSSLQRHDKMSNKSNNTVISHQEGSFYIDYVQMHITSSNTSLPELCFITLTFDFCILMCTKTALNLFQFLGTFIDVVTTRRKCQQLVH